MCIRRSLPDASGTQSKVGPAAQEGEAAGPYKYRRDRGQYTCKDDSAGERTERSCKLRRLHVPELRQAPGSEGNRIQGCEDAHHGYALRGSSEGLPLTLGLHLPPDDVRCRRRGLSGDPRRVLELLSDALCLRAVRAGSGVMLKVRRPDAGTYRSDDGWLAFACSLPHARFPSGRSRRAAFFRARNSNGRTLSAVRPVAVAISVWVMPST